MTLRSLTLVLACAAAAAPAALEAQAPAAPLVLSLDEAVSRAEASSHRIAEARARGEAAAAAVGTRHASLLPQVAAQAGYTRTNHIDEFGILLPNNQFRVIYPDIPDNYRTRLDVQWPVYTGGRLNALERAARQDEAAASSDVAAVGVDVRLDTTRAFWSLVVAREALRVTGESLVRMEAHVVTVGNQVEAGVLPPNEVLTARAQAARQRMLVAQARSNRDVAEADLARLVGVPAGTGIEPAAALAPPSTSADVSALVGEAREHRPDRRALLERLEASGLRREAATAGHRPTVAVGGGVDYARPNPRIFPRMRDWRESWDASINVNWPLFDGGRTRSETAEASAAVRALQSRLAEFDSLLELDIRQRVAELGASRTAIEAAEAAIAAALEARRVVDERFAAGVAISTDVTDAQLALLQAQLDRTQAIATARLAEARLNRALGR